MVRQKRTTWCFLYLTWLVSIVCLTFVYIPNSEIFYILNSSENPRAPSGSKFYGHGVRVNTRDSNVEGQVTESELEDQVSTGLSASKQSGRGQDYDEQDSDQNKEQELTQEEDFEIEEVPLSPHVKVVPTKIQSQLYFQHCIPLSLAPTPGVKICVNSSHEDDQQFDEGLAAEVVGLLKKDPSLEFVDIGSSVGVHTILAAACGCTVLSVESLEKNIHSVQTSLSVNDLAQNVTLINNHIQIKHTAFCDKPLRFSDKATKLNFSEISSTKKSTKTICLDQLLPLVKGDRIFIKLNLVHSEGKALACAHRLFKQVNVRVVLMSWMERPQEDRELVQEFMMQHGFKPSKSAVVYVPENFRRETLRSVNIFFLNMNKSPKTSKRYERIPSDTFECTKFGCWRN